MCKGVGVRFGEVAVVETALRNELPRGEVLELACGTGLWTRHLVQQHSRVVAIDASPEVIAINRQRVQSDRVDYVVADVFARQPHAQFDAVFFGFWLSHVPLEQFERFWSNVRASLKDRGRGLLRRQSVRAVATARDHEAVNRSGVATRRLNDGQEFRIVKIFYEPGDLERRLTELGWRGWVRSSGTFFVYGSIAVA